MSDNKTQYFALMDSEETADEAIERVNALSQSRQFKEEAWERNYDYYMGRFFEGDDQDGLGGSLSGRIRFGGENDEQRLVYSNHYRNILNHIQTLITSVEPAYNAVAINTDYKSRQQAQLADDLLEYYVKEKKLTRYVRTAVQHALLFDAGYVKVEWDVNAGQEYVPNDDGTIQYDGDIVFSNPSAFDIFWDTANLDYSQNNWVIQRSFRNKFELIDMYVGDTEQIQDPEARADAEDLREKILSLDTQEDATVTRSLHGTDFPVQNEMVEVFEFFHRKTGLLPNGRYMLFARGDIVLEDGPLPYRDIPIYQITAGKDVASQFGYSPAHDLSILQDILNMEYSSITTNHDTFGIQNIVVPRESNVKTAELTGGLRLIKYDASGANGQKPEPMNFTHTPNEIYQFSQMIMSDMETISGINSVIRGDPEPSLKSGTALAVIQQQALAYASHLQDAYIDVLEDVGTAIIRLLREYAADERVVTIAGKNNRSKMRSFDSNDLVSIDRVTVDLGNPVMNTLAGKIQVAENLLGSGLIKTGQEYMSVLETGKLNPLTDNITSQLNLIQLENERLMDTEAHQVYQATNQAPVQAMATDDHALHIKEHMTLLNDPQTRQNAPYADMVLSHIYEHINLSQQPGVQILAQFLGYQTPQTGPIGGTPDSPDLSQTAMGPQGQPGQGREAVQPQPPNSPNTPQNVPPRVVPRNGQPGGQGAS